MATVEALISDEKKNAGAVGTISFRPTDTVASSRMGSGRSDVVSGGGGDVTELNRSSANDVWLGFLPPPLIYLYIEI